MTDIDDIRFRVRGTLTKEFGDEFARDFMSLTPAFNWDDIATKSDVTGLKSEMTSEFAAVRSELTVLEARMNSNLHAAMRSQTLALSAIFGGLMAVMTTSLSLVAFFVR